MHASFNNVGHKMFPLAQKKKKKDKKNKNIMSGLKARERQIVRRDPLNHFFHSEVIHKNANEILAAL